MLAETSYSPSAGSNWCFCGARFADRIRASQAFAVFRFATVRALSVRRCHLQGMSKDVPAHEHDPRLAAEQQLAGTRAIADRMNGIPIPESQDPLIRQQAQIERLSWVRFSTSMKAAELAEAVIADLFDGTTGRRVHLEAVVPTTGRMISVTSYRFGHRTISVCDYSGTRIVGPGRRRQAGPQVDADHAEFVQNFADIKRAALGERDRLIRDRGVHIGRGPIDL
jgi:hypothetical protein